MDVTYGFQTLQLAFRVIDNPPDCTYQFVPFEGGYCWVALLYTFHQMHPAVVKTLVVYDKATRLVAQQLHHIVRRVYKYKHIPAVQVMPHVVGYYSTQHIEVLPHVRRL